MRNRSHFPRCEASRSETSVDGGSRREKADVMRECVCSISLCTNARAARLYNDRKVAAEVVVLVVGKAKLPFSGITLAEYSVVVMVSVGILQPDEDEREEMKRV